MHSPPASGLGFALQQGAQLGGPDGLVEERDVGLLDGGGGGRRGVAAEDDGRDLLGEMPRSCSMSCSPSPVPAIW
jgi:hypothetical protein